MKKNLCLLLGLILVMTVFAGCNIIPEDNADSNNDETLEDTESENINTVDIWDGSIADRFSSGSGTADDPYKISTSSELAYLAQEVNNGNSYSNNYFVLSNDINLNQYEWVSIGDGVHYFEGSFDGNGHTVKNLKMTNGANFTIHSTRKDYLSYTTGLFGVCLNATIKNLTVDTAELTIQNIVDRYTIMAGIVVGMMYSDTSFEISNVTVSNAIIKSNSTKTNMSYDLICGGVVGHIYGNDNALGTLSLLQSDTLISISSGASTNNYLGGIVGSMYVERICRIENCASYLDVNMDDNTARNNYFGAMGYVASNNDVIHFVNIFSKVTVNKLWKYYGFPTYTANAIAGLVGVGITEGCRYKFENVFGAVEQYDTETGEGLTELKLFDIPHSEIYAEITNSFGCERLPDSHFFNESIWDISDLSHPIIK